MESIITTFQIEWGTIIAQTVNFGVVLVIITFFSYKPLLRLMKEREKKIKEGLAKAEEAKIHLKEAEEIKLKKLKEAEKEALTLLHHAEERAKSHEKKLLEIAKQREIELLANAERRARAETEAISEESRRNAVAFVKQTLIKTVELKPHAIDDALIAKAAKESAYNK